MDVISPLWRRSKTALRFRLQDWEVVPPYIPGICWFGDIHLMPADEKFSLGPEKPFLSKLRHILPQSPLFFNRRTFYLGEEERVSQKFHNQATSQAFDVTTTLRRGSTFQVNPTTPRTVLQQ